GTWRIDGALLRGVEQLAVDAERVDVRLERTPARKAVLFGEIELCVSELGADVRRTQLVEPALRLLPEPLEIGRIRQRQRRGRRLRSLFWHESPSFLGKGASLFVSPCVRRSGEEVKVV